MHPRFGHVRSLAAALLPALGMVLAACSSSSGGSPDAATDSGKSRPSSDSGAPDTGIARDAHADATDAGHNDAGRADGASDAAHASDASDAAFNSVGPDGSWNIAPHDPLPQIVAYGGAIVATPVLTAITFTGYDLTTEATTIVDGIGATPYWSTALSSYGVGPATSTMAIVATNPPATIDDPGVENWLAAKLGSGGTMDLAFPAPTASSVYVIFYPTDTMVTLQGTPVCQHFGGYHNTFTLASGPSSGTAVDYVVIAECGGDAGAATNLSEALAHELTAIVTDPSPLLSPAFASIAPADETWSLLAGGGEVSDLCAIFPDSYYVPTGYPYTLQRIWSNESATASQDPCQPAPSGEVYFNASPHLTESVTLNAGGTVYQVHGVVTPLNVPKTIEVDLFSDGPTEAWTVSADDLSSTLGGGPYMTFSWDATTGQNGTKLHLTVTPLQADSYGGELFELTSTQGTTAKHWYGAVGQN